MEMGKVSIKAIVDATHRASGEDSSGVRSRLAENVLAFSLIAIGMLVVLGAALAAEFYVVEDHHLLGLQPWSIAAWFDRVRIDIDMFQRFRPMYWVYVAIGTSWFGRNPHLWHAFALFSGALSCFLFFRAARLLGASRLTGALFVALLAFSANQSWIWINLVPQETIGVLLLSISVWALCVAAGRPNRRLWDGVGFVALLLASLAKESFVLVIPAMLLLTLARERQVTGATWRECVVSRKVLLMAGALLFGVGMSIVLGIMLSKPQGYSASVSAISVSSFSPLRWFDLVVKVGLGIPLLASIVIVAARAVRAPTERALILCATLVALGWVIPQLVLYSKGIDERYLFPAVIGLAAAIALGFASLPRKLFPVPQVCMLALVAPVLLAGTRDSNKTANWFTAETVASHRMVTFLAQNTSRDKGVVVAADPGTGYGYEALYSVPIYLKLSGLGSNVYTWPLESLGGRNANQPAARSHGTAPEHPSTLAPSTFGAIVLIDTFTPGLNMGPIKGWLANSEWKEVRFDETYSHLSENGMLTSESSHVVHRALVSMSMPSSTSDGLLSVDPAIAFNVGVGQGVDGPPWGLERDYAGPGMIAWLGHGDAEGIGGTLTAKSKQKVTVTVEVIAGPSLPGPMRVAELAVASDKGTQVVRGKFAGGRWDFQAELQPGANTFRLRVLDMPTVASLPDGDQRTLLALVRHISVRE